MVLKHNQAGEAPKVSAATAVGPSITEIPAVKIAEVRSTRISRARSHVQKRLPGPT